MSSDRWKIGVFFGAMVAGLVLSVSLLDGGGFWAEINIIPEWLVEAMTGRGAGACVVVLTFISLVGAWFLREESTGWSTVILLGTVLTIIMMIPWVLGRMVGWYR